GLNTLYVNAVDWCFTFAADDNVRHIPGRNYMGGSLDSGSEPQGWLTAVDASTGAVKWKYQSKRPMVSAVTATKGDVVFTGELTGDFLALDAGDGKVLYRFNTGGGMGGGIVTYREAGKQYVAVISGKPSPFWVNEIAGAPTVFLFALPKVVITADLLLLRPPRAGPQDASVSAWGQRPLTHLLQLATRFGRNLLIPNKAI